MLTRRSSPRSTTTTPPDWKRFSRSSVGEHLQDRAELATHLLHGSDHRVVYRSGSNRIGSRSRGPETLCRFTLSRRQLQLQLLLRASDGEAFGVEKLFDAQDDFDLTL